MERSLVAALVLASCTPVADAPSSAPPPVDIETQRPSEEPEPVVARAPTVETSAPIADEPAPQPRRAPLSCSGATGAYAPVGQGMPVRGTPPQLALPGPVLFDLNRGALQPASEPVINLVAGHMLATPRVTTLRIEVHSDSRGADVVNMKLTKLRAFSVACALRSAGVHCTRLLPVGFGETKPIAPNQTAAGRAQNRRVELYHAAIDNALVAGLPLDGGGQIAGDPCQ